MTTVTDKKYQPLNRITLKKRSIFPSFHHLLRVQKRIWIQNVAPHFH